MNEINGINHYQHFLEKVKEIKSEIKKLKIIYSERKKDLPQKQQEWMIEIANTKKSIEELLYWINNDGQMNIKWDLPMEILNQLDKFDVLEEYIENLKNEVSFLYEQQNFQCRNAELFREYLQMNVNK